MFEYAAKSARLAFVSLMKWYGALGLLISALSIFKLVVFLIGVSASEFVVFLLEAYQSLVDLVYFPLEWAIGFVIPIAIKHLLVLWMLFSAALTRTKYLGRDRFSYDVRGLILDKNRYWQWNMAQRLIEAASAILLLTLRPVWDAIRLPWEIAYILRKPIFGWLYMDGTLISIRNFSSYGELDEFVFVRFDEDNYANQVRFGGDRRVIMLTQLLSVFVVVGCLAVVNGVTS